MMCLVGHGRIMDAIVRRGSAHSRRPAQDTVPFPVNHVATSATLLPYP